jgi:hypothetical protein
VFLLLAYVGVWGSHSAGIDPELGIPIFLKIITYDRNFDSENLDAITMGVVFDRSQVESYEQLRKIEKYLDDNSDLTVEGVAVTCQLIPTSAVDSVLEAVSDTQYNLFVFTSIKQGDIAALASQARANNVRTFSLDPSHIELGISVGVKVQEKGQLIMVNLDSSRREGSQFSAHLLKLCEIVEGEL